MDTAVAAEVRRTMRAPGYGHPAWREVPTEAAPCRVRPDAVEPGREALIAFTHDPSASVPDRLRLRSRSSPGDRAQSPVATSGSSRSSG